MKITTVLFILLFITASFSFSLAIKSIKPTQDPKDAPKDFFICCVEKLSNEYYTVVYATKEGSCHYPHFTHIRQVQAFIDYLETLGTVNRNGYEVIE